MERSFFGGGNLNVQARKLWANWSYLILKHCVQSQNVRVWDEIQKQTCYFNEAQLQYWFGNCPIISVMKKIYFQNLVKSGLDFKELLNWLIQHSVCYKGRSVNWNGVQLKLSARCGKSSQSSRIKGLNPNMVWLWDHHNWEFRWLQPGGGSTAQREN